MAADWFKTYWYVFAIAGGVIAIFFLYRLLKKRRGEEPEPEAPKIPAHYCAGSTQRIVVWRRLENFTEKRILFNTY
jgi:hypothetical protein